MALPICASSRLGGFASATVLTLVMSPLVHAAPGGATSHVSQELSNGGFAAGKQGWVQNKGTRFSVDPTSGRGQGPGAVLSRRTARGMAMLTDQQQVATGLNPGDKATGSVWLKSGGKRVTGRVVLRFFVDGVLSHRVATKQRLTKRYQKLTVSGVATSPRSRVDIRATFSAAPRTAKGFVDGLALTTTRTAQRTGVPADSREVLLRFDSAARLLSNDGTTSALSIATVTADGGTVRHVAGRTGSEGALRLPAYRTGMAAVRVRSAEGDALNPGAARFEFGADFVIDAVNAGADPDNGNNLIQRGLYHDRSQWKIQLDDNRPSCRVKGSRGALLVAASAAVSPGSWYRVVCARSEDRVTLTVTNLESGTVRTYARSGATGDLRPSSAGVPMSVGGKLTSSGVIVTGAADQFNGVVDNAFLDIAR